MNEFGNCVLGVVIGLSVAWIVGRFREFGWARSYSDSSTLSQPNKCKIGAQPVSSFVFPRLIIVDVDGNAQCLTQSALKTFGQDDVNLGSYLSGARYARFRRWLSSSIQSTNQDPELFFLPLPDSNSVFLYPVREYQDSATLQKRALVSMIRGTFEKDTVDDFVESLHLLLPRLTSPDVLGNMGHQFRTPLHGIFGAIELMEESTPDHAPQHEPLKYLRRSAELLSSKLDEVTTFFALCGGSWFFGEERFSPHDVVSVARESTLDCITPIRHPIDVSIDPRLPQYLFGDASNLRLVLEYLLSNAVANTPNGDVELSISVTGRGPGEVGVIFEVVDTGVGIPEAKFADVLEPFFHGEGNLSKVSNGLGLGLPICHLIVSRLGGRMGFESCINEGSRFWVQLVFQTFEPEQQVA